jgi:hypothetical protein
LVFKEKGGAFIRESNLFFLTFVYAKLLEMLCKCSYLKVWQICESEIGVGFILFEGKGSRERERERERELERHD